jgi:di/tricarboxylate transporter
MKKFCLLAIFFTGVVTVPVFLTGQSAERYIEDFPAVTEAVLLAHEQVAEISLILIMATSALAMSVFIFKKRMFHSSQATILLVLLAVITSANLFYTAYRGGQIRHTETRTQQKIMSH